MMKRKRNNGGNKIYLPPIIVAWQRKIRCRSAYLATQHGAVVTVVMSIPFRLERN